MGDEAVKWLLMQRADVNIGCSSVPRAGYTALHYAAARGHSACCRLLLAQHADVQARAASHATPLHAAMESNILLGNQGVTAVATCFRVLVEAHADLEAKDCAGRTAGDFARLENRMALADLLGTLDVVRL